MLDDTTNVDESFLSIIDDLLETVMRINVERDVEISPSKKLVS